MVDTQKPTITALSALTAWWQTTSGEIPKPRLAATAVKDIERRYRVTLPEDDGSYLTTTAPLDEFVDSEVVTERAPGKINTVFESLIRIIDNPSVSTKKHT